MISPTTQIEAFVLAGGGSRRFGRDKARALIDGVTLLEHNVATLRERYATVRVVSAPGRAYQDLGVETVYDELTDHGPLAGIHAALQHAQTDLVAVAACDLIGLDSGWFAALEAACGRGAAAFRDAERWHPLVAVYHRALLPEIEARLVAGELAVRDLLDEHGTAVDVPDGFDGLRGVNTPDELSR